MLNINLESPEKELLVLLFENVSNEKVTKTDRDFTAVAILSINQTIFVHHLKNPTNLTNTIELYFLNNHTILLFRVGAQPRCPPVEVRYESHPILSI